MDPAKEYRLTTPQSDDEWAAYHAIRRIVLFERRGQVGVYDPTHPDEMRSGHHSLLLWFEGEPIGTIRVDLADDEAVFRRVAVREDLQRQGHGRRMLELAEDFARNRGAHLARSHVDPGAVGFYKRCGFKLVGDADEPTLMAKVLWPRA